MEKISKTFFAIILPRIDFPFCRQDLFARFFLTILALQRQKIFCFFSVKLVLYKLSYEFLLDP